MSRADGLPPAATISAPRHRDHGAVVGAEAGPRRTKSEIPRSAARSASNARSRLIRSNAAADQQVGRARWPRRHPWPSRSEHRTRPPESSPRHQPAGCRARHAAWLSTQRATAVFRPENEKSNRCRSRSLRAVKPAGNGHSADRRSPLCRCRDRRGTADRAPGRPCRTPRPRRRRWSTRARLMLLGNVRDLQQRGVTTRTPAARHIAPAAARAPADQPRRAPTRWLTP